MAVGDRAAQHVKALFINLAQRLRAVEFFPREAFVVEALQVAQRLGGEGFVHIN